MSAPPAQFPYIVTGCTTPYNGKDTWPRLEINDLAKDELQFSLFIQAMKNLQAEGYTPIPASWKEIAGIHGVPWAKWAGDPDGPDGPEHSGGDQWDGYCYHSCVLFPTWHRVVLLFLEQAVSAEAQAIASKYTYVTPEEQEEWRKAALTLRFPYWDWSAPRVEFEGMPKILTYENLRLLGPGGTTLRVKNPLRGYTYDSPPDDAPSSDYKGDMRTYFSEWKRTVRWATSKNNPSDDYMALDTALKKGLSIDVLKSDLSPGKANYRPISVNREKLIRVFSFPPEVDNKDQEVACWDYFATTRPQSTLPSDIAKFVSSVEEPHNNLHNDIGGNGNMSSLEMAGYDPIFFLHHCNIDRLYALWEYVYPDYWMGKDGYAVDKDTRKQFEDRSGTYQGKPGAAITESTGLAPFRTSAGEYWTSNEVRGLTPAAPVKKYYSYPPVKVIYEKRHGWFDTLDDVPVTIDVTKPCTLDERKQYIAALQYHFGARPTLLLGPGPALPPIFRGVPAEEIPQLPGGRAVEGTRDFVVVVSLPQFAFRGSHRLELYLGGVYVGDVSVFSRTKPEKCKNCASNIASGTAIVRGVVGLPHDVVVQVLDKADANKDTTTEEEIAQILKDNLVGRIVRPDRTLLAHGESGFVTGPGPDDQTQWINQRSVGLGTYSLQQSRQTISIAHYPVLPNKNEPTLEIHSARVVVSENEFVPPVRTDVISHGAALGGEWRRWHAGADSDSD